MIAAFDPSGRTGEDDLGHSVFNLGNVAFPDLQTTGVRARLTKAAGARNNLEPF